MGKDLQGGDAKPAMEGSDLKRKWGRLEQVGTRGPSKAPAGQSEGPKADERGWGVGRAKGLGDLGGNQVW